MPFGVWLGLALVGAVTVVAAAADRKARAQRASTTVTGAAETPLTSDAHEPLSPRAKGCVTFVGLALAAVAVSLVAAAWVNSHAGPDPDVEVVGLLVLFAFAIWAVVTLLLAVVVAMLVAGDHRLAPVVAAAVVLSALVAWTVWYVRPLAPTGHDHPETLAVGQDTLRADLTAALNRATPRRGALESALDGPCTDNWGRSRGAAQAGFRINISGPVLETELDAFATELRGRGWTVERGTNRDVAGGTMSFVSANRVGYDIRLRSHSSNGRAEGEGTTPCLRA